MSLTPREIPRSSMTTIPLSGFAPEQFGNPPVWLVDDVRSNGVIEPIVVADHGDDGYEVIDGARRLGAAKHCRHADIKATVYDAEDVAQVRAAWRAALNEKRARNEVANFESVVKMLHDGYSREAISNATGLGMVVIEQITQINAMHCDIVNAVKAGRIKYSTAKLINSLNRRGARTGPVTAWLAQNEGKLTAKIVKELMPVEEQAELPMAWEARVRNVAAELLRDAPDAYDPDIMVALKSLAG
jgi:ParB/RepB/Spo0J family partition protein